MKAIKYEKPWDVACVEMDKPVRKKGEALIKIMTAGICGSDIGAFRGTNGLVSYPRVIGHELAGIIEEIDEDNPKGFKVGDHVIVDPYLYCGHCYPCSIGRTNCCTDLHVLGVHVDGGMICWSRCRKEWTGYWQLWLNHLQYLFTEYTEAD